MPTQNELDDKGKDKATKLSSNQHQVLNYLRLPGRGYVSPSKIAAALGKWEAGGHYGSSSWASPICLALVKKGLVERNERGWYCAI